MSRQRRSREPAPPLLPPDPFSSRSGRVSPVALGHRGKLRRILEAQVAPRDFHRVRGHCPSIVPEEATIRIGDVNLVVEPGHRILEGLRLNLENAFNSIV